MKPLLLKMSGIQSYREEQQIDFTKLSGAGVFGIFGPTGSGKSTILDAMTLALYGRVERASGGTQGIMNQAENKLSVSFTFELTGSHGAMRYRIERQFKRNSDISVNNTVARLTRIQDNDESFVLADKANEVNAEVQQILGLNMADFTRAVVLPQGKFAEFLLLAGKERRAMLQRLFHLERYGDQLSAKVSSKLKETDTALTALTSEQAGLGDASEAALEAAKIEASMRQAQAEESNAGLTAKQGIVDAYKEVVDLQDESEKLNVQLLEVLQNEEDIVNLEVRLKLAERAEKVRPYLEEQVVSVKIDIEKRKQLVESEQAVLSTVTLLSDAQAELEIAQKALATDEERLITRIETLKGALELEAEIAKDEIEMDTLKLRTAQILAQFEGSQQAHTNASGRRDKALLLRADLQNQLKAVSVPSEQRQKLKEVTSIAIEISGIQKQMNDLKLEETKCTESLSGWTNRRLSAEQGIANQQTKQQEQYLALANLRHLYQASEDECETIEETINQLNEGLRLLRERREHKDLAVRLSNQLHAGDACPVCGSCDHPKLAHIHSHVADELLQAYDSELESTIFSECESSLRLVRELRLELKGFSIRLSSLEKTILAGGGVVSSIPLDEVYYREAAVSDQDAKKEEIAVMDIKAEADEKGPLRDLSLKHDALQVTISDLRVRVGQLEEQSHVAEQMIAESEKLVRELDHLLRECTSQERMLTELRIGHTDKLNALTLLFEARHQVWRNHYDHDDFSVVEAQTAELERQDRASEELQDRIEKSGPVIENMQTELERLRTEVEMLQREHLLLCSQVDSAAERAIVKRQLLHARVGDEPVQALITATTAALSSLRGRSRVATAVYEHARAAHATAAEQRSAAAEGAATAAHGLAHAERRLREALELAAFATGEAALQALLASEAASEAAVRVREHREREAALRAQRTALAAKLGGREVSPDQWAHAQDELRAARLQREAALQDSARADHALSELIIKSTRWRVLEHRRAEQEVQRGRLQKLQSVFKANAFVEFLAEEQLLGVSRAASERLGKLTRRRYALEVDSGGGFVIRDDANGGVKRPVSTLSGGETFLTSLALALALSAQIQLKGEYPLEFFFLDEGFGTLDGDLLDTVITALERLHTDRVAVGVISHVPELKARLSRKLIVHPAESAGRGSRIELEEG